MSTLEALRSFSKSAWSKFNEASTVTGEREGGGGDEYLARVSGVSFEVGEAFARVGFEGGEEEVGARKEGRGFLVCRDDDWEARRKKEGQYKTVGKES